MKLFESISGAEMAEHLEHIDKCFALMFQQSRTCCETWQEAEQGNAKIQDIIASAAAVKAAADSLIQTLVMVNFNKWEGYDEFKRHENLRPVKKAKGGKHAGKT